MHSRRDFLIRSMSMAGAVTLTGRITRAELLPGSASYSVVVSTWGHGVAANDAAWAILNEGGYALDAVEAGARVPEADPGVISVGYGGLPDHCGKVTLDAAVMNEKGDAGSVCFLENIMHPVSVARLVMEETPHVMLSGKGALRFALKHGFKKQKLITPFARDAWKKWKNAGAVFKPVVNIEKEVLENHDTIGILAIDRRGRLCGACTTSGMAFKLQGRVGDSPVIGAGLFIDGSVGGAVATGSGELVLKTLGSFLVVELMRNGYTPGDACREAVMRIAGKIPDNEQHQVGFLALDIQGNAGAYSLLGGFEYAVRSEGVSGMRTSPFLK